jgi:cob(I)alamin adenosyltransferase
MIGYTQVYTGNGKGKTTAAIGLCVRAAGAGLKVFIAQFIKLGDYSEIKALRERFSESITLEQFGVPGFIAGNPRPDHKRAADRGISRVRSILNSGKYDLVILEEINVAVSLGLVSVEKILELINEKPEHVELVLTGRGADKKVIEAADLVTEMAEIKHYYAKGVKARAGIEK